MKFNKERFDSIVKPMSETERDEMEYRIVNREWLMLSEKIALKARHILRTEGVSQKEFAERMGVSEPQVSALLSGKENLSLKTISKMEKSLGRSIINVSISDSNVLRTEIHFCEVDFTPLKQNILRLDKGEYYSVVSANMQ